MIFAAAAFLGAAAATPTALHICDVVEAAYTEAIESKQLAHPVDLIASYKTLQFSGVGGDYRKRLAMTPEESADLVSHVNEDAVPHFQPVCVWKGKPVQKMDEGKPLFVSFSNPVFSTDMKLGVIEVSFQRGSWGFGLLCAVRRTSLGWTARCAPSWIV